MRRVPRRTIAGGALAMLAAGAMLLISCGGHDAVRNNGAGQPQTAGSASSAAAPLGASAAAALDQWSLSEVVKRLGEAGLVVTDQHKTVHHEGMQLAGELLNVSGSQLQVYIYPSATARRHDSATLDTATAGSGTIGMPRKPHVIINNNLIAVQYTLNDRLAEQVYNALMARHRER
ncbi:MAG TPA: hypothetical protein VFW98_13565 [Gemmatimonadaceae bacterium]|nr:hypothetical protein [Gemmatimonadaceae bacterium]